MKKVELKNFQKTKQGYEVYLGNGTFHYFKSEKAAKKFLSETSEFLTRQLYEVRNLFSDVWKQYQDNWCYYKHDKKTMSARQYADDRTVKNYLDQVENNFNLLINRCNTINGNHFAFKHLTNSIDLLKNCLKILHGLLFKRSSTFSIYQNKSLLKRLILVNNELENYGQEEATGFFKLPELIEVETEFFPLIAV